MSDNNLFWARVIKDGRKILVCRIYAGKYKYGKEIFEEHELNFFC
jgi:hypothetical protein